MTTPTTPIYELQEPAAEPSAIVAPAPPPVMSPARVNRRLLWWAKFLTWAMVLIFLGSGARWAFRAGIGLREQVWQYTRAIRFKEDVSRGYQFGNAALRFAETRAGLDPMSDALAGQSTEFLRRHDRADLIGKRSPAFRRLTVGELVSGIVGYVDSIVDAGGDYDLDYPPLRLGVMTLWVRDVQRTHPEIDTFPQDRTEDTTLRQDEDIAEPVLKFNSCCEAAAAVGMFLLVWLWVDRSFKPVAPLAFGRWWRKLRGVPRQPRTLRPRAPGRWGWTVPHGIFAFMIATSGFWYAYATLVRFPPRPAPAVSVVQIQPGDGAATIVANVNSQGQDTTWHVDFGPSPAYGHSTAAQSGDSAIGDQQVSAELRPVGAGQMIHFRVSATSAGGTTNSDDFSFVNRGAPVDVNSDSLGGLDWPSWTIWLRMLALFVIMVVSAQMLPPVHRGWACGAVAAMLVWFDPVILIDSHAWPQWDVWILPIFIFAVLAASLNWWMLAGAMIGIGCMFKGQMLLAGPMLLLWPLIGGRLGAFARVTIGFVIGAELIAWPWIVNSAAGLHWIECAMLAAALVLGVSLMRGELGRAFRQWVIDPVIGRRESSFESLLDDPGKSPAGALIMASCAVAAMVIAMALIFGGMVHRQAALPAGTMGLFLLLVLVPPWLLRRRSVGFWIIGVGAAAIWISSWAFGGSYSWATLGFAYGAVKHDQMQMGLRNYSNLTSILAQNYQWDIHDQMGTLRFAFSTPGPWRLGRMAIPAVKWSWSSDLDVKTTMALVYAIGLLIASAAAALHSRRNDRRFLVAIVVPWLMFPIVMCQMGGRYPVWASALSAGMVAVSLELSLLHIVLAVVAFATVAHQLLNYDQSRWPQLFQLMTPTFPGAGWLLVFVMAIFFVAALVPSRSCSD